jgi:hypothetical protein
MSVPASPPLVLSLPRPFSYRKRLKLAVMALAAWPVGLQKSIHPPVPVLACLSWPDSTVCEIFHVGFAALPVHLHFRRAPRFGRSEMSSLGVMSLKHLSYETTKPTVSPETPSLAWSSLG